jgi:hypothetical protein
VCAGYSESEAPVFLEVAVDVDGDEIKVSYKPFFRGVCTVLILMYLA